MGAEYTPERDGTIEQYLKACRDQSMEPMFKGFWPYRALWNQGRIEPDITYIRSMYSYGRGDEHYLVIGKEQLRGILLERHSGKEGVYNPRALLPDAPYWEIHSLNPSPIPREAPETIDD